MTIPGNFKRFQYFNFGTDLLGGGRGGGSLYRGLGYCLLVAGTWVPGALFACGGGCGGRGFVGGCFIFLDIWVRFADLLWGWFGVPARRVLVLPVGAGVLFGGASSL